ncbi:ArsR/SmtB family transcription factor [Chloroflexota bacterium]
MELEHDQARFLRCIGEPTRLSIIKLLAGGEKCVGDITRLLDRGQPLVSHHLRTLKCCNIVVERQEAQKVYYRLADESIAGLVDDSEALVRDLPICRNEEVCCEG